MYYRTRQFRVACLLLAGMLAGVAIFIKTHRLLPFENSYAVTGSFRSSLLSDAVSIYDLQSTVGAAQFQGAVGAEVSAEAIADDPHGFRLVVRHISQRHAEESFPEALQLLKVKLKSLAVSEVDASRAFLEELQQEERERKETLTPAASTDPTADRLEAALSEQDGRRAILLRKEIQDLKGFLNGGPAEAWLKAEIHRDSVTRADKKIQNAKSELLRLSTVFQTGSNPVRAQAELLRQAMSEKADLEKHISKALLDSHRAELKRLEDKSVAIVRQNAKSAPQKPKDEPVSAPQETSDSSLWLREHSQKLSERASRLERQAQLTTMGPAATTSEQPSGYWISMLLWLGALTSLIAALFVNAGPRRERRSSNQGVRPIPSVIPQQAFPTPIPAPRVEIPVQDPPEAFFQTLCQSLKKELGRTPDRILLLGSVQEERSSIALRLAKNFSHSGCKVRLVDLDLQERPLSQRIGDESSLGVSDLLLHGGPVEEFFASVPGTSIEFAPAGTSRVLDGPVSQDIVGRLLRQPTGGITIIDASFASPLHLVLSHIDVALCLTRPGQHWTSQEEQVLVAFKEAGLPVWGVTQSGSQFFPFL